MKDKIVTLKINGAAQGQWSSLLLELILINQKNVRKKEQDTKAKVDINPKTSQTLGMKEKKLTITSKNISQKQWSNLILELNLIKKAWAGYATLDIKCPGIRKIIAHGTKTTFDKD